MGLNVYYFKKKPQNRNPGYYVVAAKDVECAIAAISRLISKPAKFHNVHRYSQSGEVSYPETEGYVELVDGDIAGIFEDAIVINVVRHNVPKWTSVIKQPKGYGGTSPHINGALPGKIKETLGDLDYLQRNVAERQKLVEEAAARIQKLACDMKTFHTPLNDKRIRNVVDIIIRTADHVRSRISNDENDDSD